MNWSIESKRGNFDLFGSVPLSFTYRNSDIRSISSRGSSFSKTVKLPSTEANNKIFGSLYDFNIDNDINTDVNLNNDFIGSFNPLISLQVTVRQNGIDIFTGHLQLKNILLTNGAVVYEVVIFETIKTLIDLTKSKYLNDIDLTEYAHTKTRQHIQEASNNQIYKNGQLTQVQRGEGYTYGALNYLPQTDTTGVINYNIQQLNNIHPAYYLKGLFDKVISGAGFTYESEFINSDFFKRLVLPHNTNKRAPIPEAELSNVNSTGTIVNGTAFRRFTPDYYANGWTPYNTAIWEINLINPNYGICNEPIKDPGNNLSTGSYTVPQNNIYDINSQIAFYLRWTDDRGNDIKYKNDGAFKIKFRLRRYNNTTGVTTTLASEILDSLQPSDDVDHASPWEDIAGGQLSFLVSENTILLEDDVIFIDYQIEYSIYAARLAWGVLNNDNIQVSIALIAESTLIDGCSYLKVELADNTFSGEIEINDSYYLPTGVRQSDLLINLFKQFNLVSIPDKLKENHIKIEPYTEYIEDNPEVKDWTYKLDRQNEIEIMPLSEVDWSSYNFNYTAGLDKFSIDYREVNSFNFGDLSLTIQNDFSKNVNSLGLKFNSLATRYGLNTPQVQAGFDNDAQKWKSLKQPLPLLLDYSDLITPVDFTLYNTQNDLEVNNNGLTTPLKVLAFSDPVGHNSRYTLEYNDFNTPDGVTNYGLYTKYFKSIIEDLTNPNSKLVVAFFQLDELDINSFKFNDLIFLDGSYFRVNKIENYNPSTNELTKVELLKVNSLNIKTGSRASVININPPTGGDSIGSTAQDSPPTSLSVGGSVRNGLSLGVGNYNSQNTILIGDNLDASEFNPGSVIMGRDFEITNTGQTITKPLGLVVNSNGNFFEGLPFNVDVFKGGENQVLYRGNQRQYIVLNANIENRENY